MTIDDAMPRRSGGNPFHVGCAVELTSGALCGMTGVVVRFGRGRNCLIRLDGVQLGVLAMIDAASLKERPPGSAASPACTVTVAPPRRRRAGFDCTGA